MATTAPPTPRARTSDAEHELRTRFDQRFDLYFRRIHTTLRRRGLAPELADQLTRETLLECLADLVEPLDETECASRMLASMHRVSVERADG